jgi:hypothetical protein
LRPAVANVEWHRGHSTSPPGVVGWTLIRDPHPGQKTIMVDYSKRVNWLPHYPPG